jgi:nitrite reductase/ring-hydroxylating ferredoxin subunit
MEATMRDESEEAPCAECPLAIDRRAFLRGAAFAAAATLAALGAAPGAAFAASVKAIAPLSRSGGRRAYRLPAADSVAVDAANDVIIARWQGSVYAFSLRCPHRGTRLEWHPDETRIFCPKHKARFRADGAHDSGRSSRDLDRYGVRRQGEELIVDFDALLRADVDAAAWSLAMVKVA